MGDGRAEGSSVAGNGGQAAMSPTSDVDGTHVHIFKSSQLDGLYVGLTAWHSTGVPKDIGMKHVCEAVFSFDGLTF